MSEVESTGFAARCVRCRETLRDGARFCAKCGYNGRVAPTTPYRAQAKTSIGTFASYWAEIKQVTWLFGLLLFSSFILGMIIRGVDSPLPATIVSSIDALIIVTFASVRYRDILPLLQIPQIGVVKTLGLLGLALGFVVVMVIYFALLQRAGVPLIHVVRAYEQSGWPIWAMFLLVSVMPAIFEELAFRGVIQSALERVLGGREAWIIQAALFSVLHLSPIIFVSHFVMGLCFGYMRRQSNSLYPGMVLHGGWNALALCQELYWM